MNAVLLKSGSAETAAYGGLVDAIGGIAAAILAIVGLNGFDPVGMAAIATIVLGAALLVQGGAVVSEYAHMLFSESAGTPAQPAGGDGVAAMFLVGAAGIVLGVLAVLGISSVGLTATAVIAFGSALILSSGTVRQLYVLRGRALQTSGPVAGPGHELLISQMASGSTGVQLLTGFAAIVLGVLSAAGHRPYVLTLTALLVLGIAVLVSGSALSSLVLGFMRRPGSGTETRREATTRRSIP